MTIELPKKLKKQIIKFCEEYESLAHPHKIRVVIPRQEIIVTVSWESDNSCQIDENSIQRYLDSENVYKSKNVINYNKKIENFIKRTNEFGEKYFNDRDWLWQSVLWNYNPEQCETYKKLEIEWMDDYYEMITERI